MSAPTTVPFRFTLDIPTNDLNMLQQLADQEHCTVRDLLISTLQADLAHKAQTLGLSYRRGWHDASRLASALHDELTTLHQDFRTSDTFSPLP